MRNIIINDVQLAIPAPLTIEFQTLVKVIKSLTEQEGKICQSF